MRLDNIIIIEKYIVDAINNSPEVPLSVQVLRLADSIENEGVINQANTIVVKYSNSYTQDKNREPVVSERVLTFQLDYICQSYLSSGGQDFALTLMTAVYNTLRGIRPNSAEGNVIEGFRMSRESFEGITEESQYAYVQEWELVLEEVSSECIIDPCVARGNCSQVFPPPGVDEPLEPWEVASDCKVWTPACTTDTEGSCGVVIDESGNWSYICDNSVFIPEADIEDVVLLSSDVITPEGYLIVRGFRISTGDLYGEFLYCDTNKRISCVNFDLYRSPIDLVGVEEVSSREFLFRKQAIRTYTSGFIRRNSIAVSDPTNPNALVSKVSYGQRLGVQENVTLEVSGVTWVLTNINGTPWVPLDKIYLIKSSTELTCPDYGIECN